MIKFFKKLLQKRKESPSVVSFKLMKKSTFSAATLADYIRILKEKSRFRK